jgi:hypothetical protein
MRGAFLACSIGRPGSERSISACGCLVSRVIRSFREIHLGRIGSGRADGRFTSAFLTLTLAGALALGSELFVLLYPTSASYEYSAELSQIEPLAMWGHFAR